MKNKSIDFKYCKKVMAKDLIRKVYSEQIVNKPIYEYPDIMANFAANQPGFSFEVIHEIIKRIVVFARENDKNIISVGPGCGFIEELFMTYGCKVDCLELASLCDGRSIFKGNYRYIDWFYPSDESKESQLVNMIEGVFSSIMGKYGKEDMKNTILLMIAPPPHYDHYSKKGNCMAFYLDVFSRLGGNLFATFHDDMHGQSVIEPRYIIPEDYYAVTKIQQFNTFDNKFQFHINADVLQVDDSFKELLQMHGLVLKEDSLYKKRKDDLCPISDG